MIANLKPAQRRETVRVLAHLLPVGARRVSQTLSGLRFALCHHSRIARQASLSHRRVDNGPEVCLQGSRLGALDRLYQSSETAADICASELLPNGKTVRIKSLKSGVAFCGCFG
jgi:hypothetical protein